MSGQITIEAGDTMGAVSSALRGLPSFAQFDGDCVKETGSVTLFFSTEIDITKEEVPPEE
jgi:hypothetical protein